MANVPSPVQRMDSSGDSSSSYSETSDSESEDSSSGSQTGGDKIDTVIPKITPNNTVSGNILVLVVQNLKNCHQ